MRPQLTALVLAAILLWFLPCLLRNCLRERVADRSDPEDHDFRGFDQGSRRLSWFQLHFAGRPGCDDGCNGLVSDGERDFGHESADANVFDAAYELVPAADAAEYVFSFDDTAASSSVEKPVHFALRNAVVSTRCLGASNLPGINPLLDGWEADSELESCLTRLQENRVGFVVGFSWPIQFQRPLVFQESRNITFCYGDASD